MTKAVIRTRTSHGVFASLIAFIMHPVIIGTLGLLLVVMNNIPSLSDQLMYLAILVLITFVPAALYLFVLFKGNIGEMLELIDREARLVPYVLMILGAIAAIILLSQLEAPRAVFVMTLVLLANEVILGTINFWTKVSIHTATATFTGLTVGYLVDPIWYALVFLVPLIAWARVYQKRHTINQVVGGTFFAALVTTVVIFLTSQFIK